LKIRRRTISIQKKTRKKRKVAITANKPKES